jgi:hypothetical protein
MLGKYKSYEAKHRTLRTKIRQLQAKIDDQNTTDAIRGYARQEIEKCQEEIASEIKLLIEERRNGPPP